MTNRRTYRRRYGDEPIIHLPHNHDSVTNDLITTSARRNLKQFHDRNTILNEVQKFLFTLSPFFENVEARFMPLLVQAICEIL